MTLTEEPFFAMQSKEKNVELRLKDKKRSILKVEDCVTFFLRDNSTQKVVRKITALHSFKDFKAAYEKYPEEKKFKAFQYYRVQDMKDYGVIAIEFA